MLTSSVKQTILLKQIIKVISTAMYIINEYNVNDDVRSL